MSKDYTGERLHVDRRYISDTHETELVFRLDGQVTEEMLADMIEAIEAVWDGRAEQERKRMEDTVALLKSVIQGYKP